MSAFRAYFYDLTTRKEMIDFPSNGKTWLGTSGMKLDSAGNFIPDSCTFIDVADYADLKQVKNEKRISADDFNFPVAVKIWYGPNKREWRKLL